MAIFTSQNQKSKTGWIILGIFILLIIVAWLIFGIKNIFKIIIFLLEASLLLATLGAIAYLFYFLFIKKQRYDVLYVNKQKIIEACKKYKNPLLKDLYLSGDKTHTRAKLGKIINCLRMQTVTRKYVYKDAINKETGETYKIISTQIDEKGQETPQYELEQIETDVFCVKNKGIMGIFSDPMIIRTEPDQHDELIGDVTLFGYSIIPIGEYWFLNSDHLDVRKIDYSILQESVRHLSLEILRDAKSLIDSATGLDAKHKKGIEQKALYEIPELSQQSNQNMRQ
jgi:hypothetical protein